MAIRARWKRSAGSSASHANASARLRRRPCAKCATPPASANSTASSKSSARGGESTGKQRATPSDTSPDLSTTLFGSSTYGLQAKARTTTMLRLQFDDAYVKNHTKGPNLDFGFHPH